MLEKKDYIAMIRKLNQLTQKVQSISHCRGSVVSTEMVTHGTDNPMIDSVVTDNPMSHSTP